MTNDLILQQRHEKMEEDYGIKSMEESMLKSDSGEWVVPKVKLLSQQKSSRFRMIVCGDSGIGKSALVQTFTGLKVLPTNDSPFEPIEVYVPDTDTCIIDTIGYGALLRAEEVFGHVKRYLENQFEKTNNIFNSNYTRQEELKYMVYQSNEIFTHVDVCLYVIMGRLKAVDIEYMRSIHDLVNIIPVIVQADLTLRQETRIQQRLDILNSLKSNEINICLLGYRDYDEMIQTINNSNYCPPFMLDWSSSSSSSSTIHGGNKKKLFHGLLPLKQVLFQHQYKYLKYSTTEKFIKWWCKYNNNHHSTIIQDSNSSSLTTATMSSSSSSSQEQVKSNNIRISHYITKRRHSMEREILIQEKKLLDELRQATKEKKIELILKETSLILKQDFNNQTNQPVTYHYYFWFSLSIVLSLFICYQNGSSLITTKCK